MGSNSSKVNENYCSKTEQCENQKRNILCPHCREHILSQVNQNNLEDNKNEITGNEKPESKILHKNKRNLSDDRIELRNGKKILKNTRKLRKRRAKPHYNFRKRKHNNKTFSNNPYCKLTRKPIRRKGILIIASKKKNNNLNRNLMYNEKNTQTNNIQDYSRPSTSGLQNIKALPQNSINNGNENQKGKGKGKQIKKTNSIISLSSSSEGDNSVRDNNNNSETTNSLDKEVNHAEGASKSSRENRSPKPSTSHQNGTDITETTLKPPDTSYFT